MQLKAQYTLTGRNRAGAACARSTAVPHQKLQVTRSASALPTTPQRAALNEGLHNTSQALQPAAVPVSSADPNSGRRLQQPRRQHGVAGNQQQRPPAQHHSVQQQTAQPRSRTRQHPTRVEGSAATGAAAAAAAAAASVRQCRDWQGLERWLQQLGSPDPDVQQQPSRVQRPRWQQLRAADALLVVQHASYLAGKLQRHKHHLDQAAAAELQVSAPAGLQPVLQHLLLAAAPAACTNSSSSADAAMLLRALARLRSCSPDQEQQLGGQLLLWLGRTAGAAGDLRNLNLLSDVADAVLRLQLQPTSDWVAWFHSTTLQLMQQPGAHAAQPNSWFLITSLRLAARVQQQEAAALELADDAWLAAWVSAADRLHHPFTPAQLSAVTAAAVQLQQQLPASFWQTQLAPSARGGGHSDSAVATQASLPRLLAVLRQLAKHHQHQGRPPATWETQLAAAVAAALPGAVAAAAAAGGAGAASSDSPVCLAARSLDCLVALGWSGASGAWCEQLWQGVLSAAAGAQPQQQQQQQQQQAQPELLINRQLMADLRHLCTNLSAACSLASQEEQAVAAATGSDAAVSSSAAAGTAAAPAPAGGSLWLEALRHVLTASPNNPTAAAFVSYHVIVCISQSIKAAVGQRWAAAPAGGHVSPLLLEQLAQPVQLLLEQRPGQAMPLKPLLQLGRALVVLQQAWGATLAAPFITALISQVSCLLPAATPDELDSAAWVLAQLMAPQQQQQLREEQEQLREQLQALLQQLLEQARPGLLEQLAPQQCVSLLSSTLVLHDTARAPVPAGWLSAWCAATTPVLHQAPFGSLVAALAAFDRARQQAPPGAEGQQACTRWLQQGWLPAVQLRLQQQDLSIRQHTQLLLVLCGSSSWRQQQPTSASTLWPLWCSSCTASMAAAAAGSSSHGTATSVAACAQLFAAGAAAAAAPAPPAWTAAAVNLLTQALAAHQQRQAGDPSPAAHEAGAAVCALAKLSSTQPPTPEQQLQLQQQLLPLLPSCSTASLVQQLLAFAMHWRVQPSGAWLAAFFAACQPQLLSAAQLQACGVCLALLHVPVPVQWMRCYVGATAAVLGAGQHSPHHPLEEEQQQQQLSAFAANTGCALARLGVTPNPGWQAAWRRCVSVSLPGMTPHQLLDVLAAAAAWAPTQEWQLPASAQAAAAGADSSSAGQQQQEHQQQAQAAVASSSDGAGTGGAAAHTGGSLAPGLQRPAYPPVGGVPAAASATAAAADAGAGAVVLPGVSQAWVLAVLRQLRLQLHRCDSAVLSRTMVTLQRLGFKAPLAWLDAVYDQALLCLAGAALPQLLQLLQGLLHQGHVLAPSRLDCVLEAAAAQLAGSSSGGDGGAATRKQLVRLLQVVVQLRQEPQAEWGTQVAGAALQMLLEEQGGSGSSSSWSPWLLACLLDALTQLDVPLSSGWQRLFRLRVRCQLPRFSGLALPLLLSALARLHNPCAPPRPFMQQLLLQLRRQLRRAGAGGLGLVGVSLGQLGLPLGPAWSAAFMAAVRALAGRRLAVRDAANLQRGVQFLSWCAGRARLRNGRGSGGWRQRRGSSSSSSSSSRRQWQWQRRAGRRLGHSAARMQQRRRPRPLKRKLE